MPTEDRLTATGESCEAARHQFSGQAMTERLMSTLTQQLMLLLHDDGVDSEELKALVNSAFRDGVAYTMRSIRPTGPVDES